MIKTSLLVLSVLLIVRGVTALIPSLTALNETQWVAISEIVAGLVGFALANSAKK